MKILLIEDNRADARLIEIMLRQIDSGGDYQMNWVNTLADGLAQMANEPVFDVVLTDLGLPDSFGVDTLKQVMAGSSGVPVIVLSGDDDEDRRLEMKESGASGCLSKNDLDEEMLRSALNEVVRSPA